AQSVKEYFANKQNIDVIDKLKTAGLRFEEQVEAPRADLPLAGKSFVITGTLRGLSRLQAEERIRQLGGHVGSSVTKKTDFLVVGADPGSKLQRAQTLGIEILTDEQFQKMLEQGERPTDGQKQLTLGI
ncbi:MAG: BRCT domain-containing protein, partial [Chloroflexota bacterium]